MHSIVTQMAPHTEVIFNYYKHLATKVCLMYCRCVDDGRDIRVERLV